MKPSRRASHPAPLRVPSPGRPPVAARIAAIALTLLGLYAFLFGVTFLDVLFRLATALLSGGVLPTWAIAGVFTGLFGTLFGVTCGRRLLRAVAALRDQDPRSSARTGMALAAVVVLHATLVAGPLNRWSPAAPLAGEALLGSVAVFAIPLVALLAVVATIAHSRAQGWLHALPE